MACVTAVPKAVLMDDKMVAHSAGCLAVWTAELTASLMADLTVVLLGDSTVAN